MSEIPSVAIVGRPNVGKSRLFNRLVGKRISIVHDQPGVTRDIVMHEVDGELIIMDTGGIGMKTTQMSPQEINSATDEQVDFAIQAAKLIVFVTDGQDGLTTHDREIADKLRTYGKETILVVNKVDSPSVEKNIDSSFYSMGFSEVHFLSAEHGSGTQKLLSTIKEKIRPFVKIYQKEDVVETYKSQDIRICFVGRPNVGKSSIGNSLLKSKRLIVSNIPGTTRDSVTTYLDYTAPDETHCRFELIDTAGLRPKTKVDSPVEFFSGLRTEEAVMSSDVVFLVIDALDGVTKQDKKIAGEIIAGGRALIIVVNKWDYAQKQFEDEALDGYEDIQEFKAEFVKAVRKELFFLPASPIIFTSAKEGYAVSDILKRAKGLFDRMHKKLTTSKLNKAVQDLIERQKPKIIHGKRFKIYYVVQVGNNPYKIKVFCNVETKIEDHYMRYLEKNLNDTFQLKGCPIQFEFIGKDRSRKK